jgi:hypothetical protein
MIVLSKWYCDCVSDEGIAFIGYWAHLRWGILAIPYAATLYRPLDDGPRERYSLRGCTEPSTRDNGLSWDCGRLGIRAAWTAAGVPAVQRVLLETPDGSVTWRCHFPRAQARIDLAGTGQVSGLGYAEHITLSVKPWRLPFEELRWGRFLSAEDAVTWIEWRGREARQWVFHNDAELQGATIDTERVELPGDRGVVELRDAVVLREGRLASTALRAIPGARFWLPGGIRHAHETKYLSRGTLATSTRSSSGWAVHEVVRLR